MKFTRLLQLKKGLGFDVTFAHAQQLHHKRNTTNAAQPPQPRFRLGLILKKRFKLPVPNVFQEGKKQRIRKATQMRRKKKKHECIYLLTARIELATSPYRRIRVARSPTELSEHRCQQDLNIYTYTDNLCAIITITDLLCPTMYRRAAVTVRYCRMPFWDNDQASSIPVCPPKAGIGGCRGLCIV